MKSLLVFPVIFFITISHTSAQIFFEVTDSGNDLATAPGAPSGSYTGCAWIDYDNDGLLDMFWSQRGLYHNTGGSFEKNDEAGIALTYGIGTSWSDYDNDGFIDCFLSGGGTNGSALFKNNGNGTFSKISDAPFSPATNLRSWACAWGDVNNDSYTDIVLAAPFGFAGIDDENKFLVNNGDGTFEKIDSVLIAQGTAPYTVPTWSDYDFDGDIDCFIGSGPANGTVAPDYLYKNELTETGSSAYFTKITTAPIATDAVDGQVWNWIDYDNDGDLDAYLTNYVGTSGGPGMHNNLYRNDGGVYVKMTETEVGDIVSDAGLSLASVWEDFDNDGDLDCIVTNDGTNCEFYYNNNDGSFTKDNAEAFVLTDGFYYGTAAADYDRDGDVDLFLSGVLTARGLFENTASTNGNNWVNFEVKGIGSSLFYSANKSALGTKVKIKANINGTDVWQFREISAQNSFGSMNSLNVEFGLGDAEIIDSLIVSWPTGYDDTCTNIPANNFYEMNELQCPQLIDVTVQDAKPAFQFEITPNPVYQNMNITVSTPVAGDFTIEISDLNGKQTALVFSGFLHKGDTAIQLNTAGYTSGIYFCKLVSGGKKLTKKFEIIK